ncbi:MAG TPA: DUF4382 domain-containing protein [Candidatus Binataceae bacterium]|nr:DUF4382 domain-containing protein [Candidatus Binataceae bacterium]
MSHPRSQVGAGRFAVLALSILALAAGLGSSTTALAAGSSNVSVHLSNSSRGAASCKVSGITHIYVAISDVKAHRSGKGNHGFTSLTNGSPQQFDLLFASSESSEAIGSSDCPIVDLGGTGLAPGKYQQIRLMTVANGAMNGASTIIPSSDNACVTAGKLADTVYDCVADSTGTYYPLTIPSGSQTGIKIPSSQISRGGFSITAGQGADLDVDIDACQSLIVHGPHGKSHGKHGKPGGSTSYAFKPVLHTGEVSLQPIIAGAVEVGATSGPDSPVTLGTTAVPGAEVFLEMEPSAPNVFDGTPGPSAKTTSVNTIVAEATTDSDGGFSFCPVPVGTYDIVVDSQSVPSSANPSDATITTGVVVGQASGPNNLAIPLLAASGLAATLHAQVTTTTNGVIPGTGDDIAFQGTQGFGTADADQAPIPLYSGTASIPVTTTLTSNGCASTCPAGTNCVCFAVVAPPDNPVTGPASGAYTSGASGAEYSLFGKSSSIATPGLSECTPSELISAPPASTLATPTISFTSCD